MFVHGDAWQMMKTHFSPTIQESRTIWWRQIKNSRDKNSQASGHHAPFHYTRPNHEVLWGEKTWPRWCLCALPVSKKPLCFSVMWRYRYATLRPTKKEGTRECARTTCSHTRTHKNTHTHTPCWQTLPLCAISICYCGLWYCRKKYSEGSDGRGRNDEPRRSRLPT